MFVLHFTSLKIFILHFTFRDICLAFYLKDICVAFYLHIHSFHWIKNFGVWGLAYESPAWCPQRKMLLNLLSLALNSAFILSRFAPWGFATKEYPGNIFVRVGRDWGEIGRQDVIDIKKTVKSSVMKLRKIMPMKFVPSHWIVYCGKSYPLRRAALSILLPEV